MSRSLAAAPAKFGALHHPDYRRYVLFALVGQIAENVEHVISYWVIYQSFHSPTLAGFAVISHWVPYLVFSVYTGALADRYDCRKLIQMGTPAVRCTVASCNTGRLKLRFCSVGCWQKHVPTARHRKASHVVTTDDDAPVEQA